jgi:nitrous oxide reductase accessory protein NosL
MRRLRMAIAGGLLLAGCASPVPPPIRTGAPCAVCSMEIQDRRYACERRVESGGRTEWRAYDAIECLLRDAGGGATPTDVWLADYDAAALHRADSLWVVHGDLPSPMGGGYVAFLNRAAADEIASASRGTVGRLATFTKEGGL